MQVAEIQLDPEIKINICVPERNLVTYSWEYKMVAMWLTSVMHDVLQWQTIMI